MCTQDGLHIVLKRFHMKINILLTHLQYVSPVSSKIIKYEVFLFNFWPISFIKVRFLAMTGFGKVLGTNHNWGKWWDTVGVMLPGINS